MIFHHKDASVFVPDRLDWRAGLERTTHLALGAHADDLEILGYHGIQECYGSRKKWFTGVVATDGAGSPRGGKFKRKSDREMVEIRKKEQMKAARIGKYAAVVQLAYSSAHVKGSESSFLIRDLFEVFRSTQPDVVYTHNLADKHDTHVAVTLCALEALRSLPPSERPQKVLGCEVWRDLDWYSGRMDLDVSKDQKLARRLLSSFESQIVGGKRYDLATLGRRLANATFADARSLDKATSVIGAMDLTPLLANGVDIEKFLLEKIDRFRDEVEYTLRKLRVHI